MPNETTALHVKLEGEQKELIIRQGLAEPIVTPNQVRLAGNIQAPGDFFENRKDLLDFTKIHLLVDRPNRTLLLVTNEQYRTENHEVSGTLAVNPKLREMQINTEKTFSLQEIIKLIKFRRHLFATIGDYSKLMESLKTFNVKSTSEATIANDGRGNTTKNFEKQVKIDLLSSFPLLMNLYQGERDYSFTVELLYDYTDGGGIRFWLESVELAEMLEQHLEEILKREVERFGKNTVAVIWSN